MDDEIITVESSPSLDSIILHKNTNDECVQCPQQCVQLNTLKSSSINITYDDGDDDDVDNHDNDDKQSTSGSPSSAPLTTNIDEESSSTMKPSVSRYSGYSMLNNFKKRIKQFNLIPSKSIELHKSMHNLSISPKKSNSPSTSSNATMNANSTPNSVTSSSVNILNLTQDVPDDIMFIENDHEKALYTVTSLTEEQLLLLQSSWSLVKQHIEKIGVITFLGIFEQHSDFRDAFTEFRKRKFVDIKHDPAMQVHGLRVLSVVDKLITRLPKTDDIERQLLVVGSKHCRYVPTITLVSSVSDQLWGAIEPVLKEEGLWSDDLAVTWKSVLDYLTKTVKYGLAKTFHSTHK
ncbi:unnamed protein product [Schistosoma turkestanicum]|nr:unnamed protein product [Schistosoma turkestanicum]